jgi:hypothetical protein
MRFLADIPDEDVKWLDSVAREQGKSRAQLLREAVSKYKVQTVSSGDKNWLDQAFGIWEDRHDIGDPVEWQRRERAGWTRSWDDDYESVKVEFPDLFDEEDDRQRQIYLDMLAGKHAERKRGKT